MKKFICFLAVLAMVIKTSGQTRYDLSKMQRETLTRGLVAVRASNDSVLLSWRYLSSDPLSQSFTLFRDGREIGRVGAGRSTTFMDYNPSNDKARYEVRPSSGKLQGAWILPAHAPVGYLDIPLQRPGRQAQEMNRPASQRQQTDGRSERPRTQGSGPRFGEPLYVPNDASMADLDNDGEMEIVLKWEGRAHDNSHSGFTDPVIFDAYKLDGTRLWRINLGRNIRAGAHYTQFMVYDLDGDGSAEVVMKTADGTIDGLGRVIGDSTADWRHGADLQQVNPRRNNSGNQRVGYIDRGPEYLTVFNGRTGEAIETIDYVPERGNLMDWGDNYANRSERYLACVAYLDGLRPSVVMCRGYYTRMTLAAFDFDGKHLRQRWFFDSNEAGPDYHGQGNHNLRVGDVDGDGKDEIVYGSCAIDHDGKGLYSTRMGHGDAMHMTAFFPNDDRLYVWDCHENKRDGAELHDAATGKVLVQFPSNTDVGRCMATDIDPTNPGLEMWSLANGISNIKGELYVKGRTGVSTNMAVWWDGDLLRELLDHEQVAKYDWVGQKTVPLIHFDDCAFNNSTKSNPCLQADVLGDWREEVLVRTRDGLHLRLYISTLPTPYRFHTFLEDPVYRLSIVYQNVAYNQPTQPGFFFGEDLKTSGKLFRGWQF